jgi:hemerythrin
VIYGPLLKAVCNKLTYFQVANITSKKEEQTMAYMNWNDDLSVGVREIDEQHRKLIGMVNAFYEKLKENDKVALGSLLASLTEYTVYHFKTEEKYMDKFNYQETDKHKNEHRLFVEKVSEIKARFDSGKFILTLEITSFVKDWIAKHVMGSDKRYTNCFISNGL